MHFAGRLDNSRKVLRGGHEDAAIQLGNLDPYNPNTTAIVRVNCAATMLLGSDAIKFPLVNLIGLM